MKMAIWIWELHYSKTVMGPEIPEVARTPNWTVKLIVASLEMGVKIQFQTLRAGGFNLNLSKADEQPQGSTYVICTLRLLTASFGCLHEFTPNSKLRHDCGFS